MNESKLLKHRVWLTLSVMVLVIALMSGIASADKKNFLFVNNSGRTIKSLYIYRSHYYSMWPADMLGMKLLRNGESVNLSYDDKFRYFDIKVVFSEGESKSWSDCDFSSLEKLTLRSRNDTYYLTWN